MLSHVNVCKSTFYHLCTISRIRKHLPKQTTEILIHAFVTSKLDHYNSLLYNVPKNVIKRLQSVQNTAIRLITRSWKCDHVTPILLDLHWLPVSEQLNSRFFYLPSRFCISNPHPIFKTKSPATYCLDRVIFYAQSE